MILWANPGDAKYGMTTEQLFEAFKILKSKGAKEFGIHAFLASNTVTNDYYPMLAKVLFEQAVKLRRRTEFTLNLSISLRIGIPPYTGSGAKRYPCHRRRVRRVYEEVLVPAGMEMWQSIPSWTFYDGTIRMSGYNIIHEKAYTQRIYRCDACRSDVR